MASSKRSTRFSLVAVAFLATVALSAQTSFAKGAQPLGEKGEDSSTEQALRQTQSMMTNQAERAKVLANDPKARAADQTVRQSLGEHTEGAYQISSEVLETIVRQSGGDAEKMQALANELLANPHALEKYLTPDQREKIRHMADEIDAKNGKARLPAAK